VSSGLLRHHFGSKDGLRRACDDYAMAELNKIRSEILSDGQTMFGGMHPAVIQLQRYLVRSTLDSPASTSAMFGRMVEIGEQWIAEQDIHVADPRAYAAVLVAMQMGMFLMADQMTASLGTDVTKPAGHLRMMAGAIDVFTHPLPADQEAAARAVLKKLAAESLEEGTP
jgi:AcrR family transcriptional regulator